MSGRLYGKYERRYRAVLTSVADRLSDLISDHLSGTPRIDKVAARAKTPERFCVKAQRKNESGRLRYRDPFSEIQDQIGARVVVFYQRDVEYVETRVRLLLARFPADQGVIAQEERQHLNLEFIERVFMKSAKAYKSVFFEGLPTDGNFWDGKAVDKQISNVRELSNYWIGEFLASELRTTGPAGTKRLAVALREAIRSSTDAQVRKDLLAASELLRGQHGRRISPERFAESLGLSDEATTALKDALPRPELFREIFQFDTEEFDRHAFFRSVELDNGAFLTAQNAQFDEIFRKEALQTGGSRVRYTTEGTIVKEQLRKIR
jgi:hypothetical protein